MSKIWNYPSYKYWTVKYSTNGSLRPYNFGVFITPEYNKKFAGKPLEIFFPGPLSWKRPLQEDWLKLISTNSSNLELRVVSSAIFSSDQPPGDIGVVLKIPTEIADHPRQYIRVVVVYDGSDRPQVDIVDDKPHVNSENLNEWTLIQLPNKYFG